MDLDNFIFLLLIDVEYVFGCLVTVSKYRKQERDRHMVPDLIWFKAVVLTIINRTNFKMSTLDV